MNPPRADQARPRDWISDDRLADLRSTGMTLRQRLGVTAAAIAATEERVADTLERLASARPQHADRLRARAEQARLFAAQERERAAMYGFTVDDDANTCYET